MQHYTKILAFLCIVLPKRKADMYNIINIDTNSIIEENGEIYLSEDTVRYFKLEDGMSVEAYMDDEVWQAVVHKYVSSNNTDLWYVKLGTIKEHLSNEQYKWNKVGFSNGFCLGSELEQKGVIQRMIDMGFDLDTIDKIVCMSTETRNKCKKIIDGR